MMAIKILAVQIWAFCAPASWSGQGPLSACRGPSALLTGRLLVLLGMPPSPVEGYCHLGRLADNAEGAPGRTGRRGLAAHVARPVEGLLT